jgi:DoxX-like family
MSSVTQSPAISQSAVTAAPTSKKMLWTGRVISAIPILLMIFSAVMKLIKAAPLVQGMSRYGYPESQVVTIGVLELLSCIVYVIPNTAVLGAILMTGYLGGATATNFRMNDPSYIMTFLLGVFVWGGLFFRDARVRALLPLRS